MPTATQVLHKAVPRLAQGDEKAKKLERRLLKLALHLWGKGPERLKSLGVVVSERTWSKVEPDPATFWEQALEALDVKRFVRLVQATRVELKARLQKGAGSGRSQSASGRSRSSSGRSSSRRSSGRRAGEETSGRAVKRRTRAPEEETAPRRPKRPPAGELAIPESGEELAIPGSGEELAIPESGDGLVVPESDAGGIPDLANLELATGAESAEPAGQVRFGDDDGPGDAEAGDPTAAAERALARYRESGDHDELEEARRLYKVAVKEAQGKIAQGVARAGLARTYLLGGQREKAHDHAKKALKLFPAEPTAVEVWVRSEREESAARAQAEALLARANTLIEREQPQALEKVAKELAKLAPESALPALVRLAAAVEQHTEGEALEPILAAAWKAYPGDPDWADVPLGPGVENAVIRGAQGWLKPRWEGEGADVLKQAVKDVESKQNLVAGAWQLSLGVARVALSTRRRPPADDRQRLMMQVGHALFFAQYYDHAKEVYGSARTVDRGGPFVLEINKQETQCGVMRRGFDRPGVKAKMGQCAGVGLTAYRKALGQRLEQAIRERDTLQQKISQDVQKVVGGIVKDAKRRKAIAKSAQAAGLDDPFARLDEVEAQLASIASEVAARGEPLRRPPRRRSQEEGAAVRAHEAGSGRRGAEGQDRRQGRRARAAQGRGDQPAQRGAQGAGGDAARPPRRGLGRRPARHLPRAVRPPRRQARLPRRGGRAAAQARRQAQRPVDRRR
ncbi:MAG: hypothetical protein R3F62_02045 [Planctomycetota bacterium]